MDAPGTLGLVSGGYGGPECRQGPGPLSGAGGGFQGAELGGGFELSGVVQPDQGFVGGRQSFPCLLVKVTQAACPKR